MEPDCKRSHIGLGELNSQGRGFFWHLGGLDILPDAQLDLAVADCVFSSILDDELRHDLTSEMWRVVKPGARCMIFDFRYDNPSNSNVRKVTRPELAKFWPQAVVTKYRTLLLAPPIVRRLADTFRLIFECFITILPPLRSYFIYMAQKPPPSQSAYTPWA